MNQPDVIEVSETVNASSEKIWNLLMDVDSWEKWWGGHRLRKVEPTWEKGATLIWDRGNDATILEFKPQTLLDFGGTTPWGEVHHCVRLTEKTGATKIVYGFIVKGADIGEKDTEKQKMTETLKRLKEAVEGVALEQTKSTQVTGSEVKPSQDQVSLEEFLGEFKESALADFKKRLTQQEPSSSIASGEKALAHELALAWWKEAKAHGRTSAVCDSCNAEISEGEGYLCKPAILNFVGGYSPDLVCESCFDRKSYEPWKTPTSSVQTEKEQKKDNVAATQKDIAWQKIEQNQKCEKCLINSGHPFTFYYGEMIAEKSNKVDYKTTETATTYRVAGAQQVIICAECIKQQSNKKTRENLWVSLIAGAIAAGAYFSIEYFRLYESDGNLGLGLLAMILVLSLLAFFGGIFSVLKYYLSSERYREKESLEYEIGNNIAISLREKTLKDQGFDQTWTPKSYEFLRSGQIIRIQY